MASSILVSRLPDGRAILEVLSPCCEQPLREEFTSDSTLASLSCRKCEKKFDGGFDSKFDLAYLSQPVQWDSEENQATAGRGRAAVGRGVDFLRAALEWEAEAHAAFELWLLRLFRVDPVSAIPFAAGLPIAVNEALLRVDERIFIIRLSNDEWISS